MTDAPLPARGRVYVWWCEEAPAHMRALAWMEIDVKKGREFLPVYSRGATIEEARERCERLWLDDIEREHQKAENLARRRKPKGPLPAERALVSDEDEARVIFSTPMGEEPPPPLRDQLAEAEIPTAEPDDVDEAF